MIIIFFIMFFHSIFHYFHSISLKVGHSIAGDCSQIEQSFNFTSQIIINNYYELTKLYQNYQQSLVKSDSSINTTLKTSLKHICKELLSFFSSKKISKNHDKIRKNEKKKKNCQKETSFLIGMFVL